MRIDPGAASDVGRVREGNEDSYLVDPRLRVYAVADGMGGHRAGEVASATALEALRAAVAAGTPIGDAVAAANRAVFEKAADDHELEGMGTTLTALAITGTGVVIGHVGDSRAYVLHDGELRQATDDHSLVEELVREGRLTPEQAAVHPQRSIITRALGVDGSVEVDLVELPVVDGDRVLLCSDGLTGMLREPDIAAILRREPDPSRAANLLVDAANAAGGEDNITVLVLDVLDDGVRASDATAVLAVEAPAAAPEPSVEAVPVDVPEAGATFTAADAAVTRQERRERRKRRGRATRRVIWVAIPVVLVIVAAVAITGWYARRTFYVDANAAGTVTIYRGRPGGVLGWDPTVEQRTTIVVKDLQPAAQDTVAKQRSFSSLADAQALVDRLATATTTTTTTTTLPLGATGATGVTGATGPSGVTTSSTP